MKKSLSITITVLVITNIFSTFTLHGAKKQIAKEEALQQFNGRFEHFRHCLQGNCTKTEALKVARDLGIAATAAIVAVYLTKNIFKRTNPELKLQQTAEESRDLDKKHEQERKRAEAQRQKEREDNEKKREKERKENQERRRKEAEEDKKEYEENKRKNAEEKARIAREHQEGMQELAERKKELEKKRAELELLKQQ